MHYFDAAALLNMVVSWTAYAIQYQDSMEWYFELRNLLGMITTMVIIPGSETCLHGCHELLGNQSEEARGCHVIMTCHD